MRLKRIFHIFTAVPYDYNIFCFHQWQRQVLKKIKKVWQTDFHVIEIRETDVVSEDKPPPKNRLKRLELVLYNHINLYTQCQTIN